MTDDATAMREDASMHRHEQEREAALRHPVRRSEHDDASTMLAARAAAAGRTDVLGAASVLRLQRAAGNAGVAQLLDSETDPESPVKGVVGRGGGAPLEPAVRERMESSFGADFSDVRVHSGGGAAESAQAVNAHAYTVGNEIVMGDGQAQGSAGHERTLAHELTHVVQQRSGPVEGTPAAGGIAISDPNDRFERAAEATADSVVSTGHAGDVGGQAAPAIQRGIIMEGPEEEAVQELSIQRRGEAEEEPEDVPRPEESPAEVQRPEEAAGAAQTGASEVQRPAEEEREEVQQLALQRAAGDERIGVADHLLP